MGQTCTYSQGSEMQHDPLEASPVRPTADQQMTEKEKLFKALMKLLKNIKLHISGVVRSTKRTTDAGCSGR